jgi:hypothetical protein
VNIDAGERLITRRRGYILYSDNSQLALPLLPVYRWCSVVWIGVGRDTGEHGNVSVFPRTIATMRIIGVLSLNNSNDCVPDRSRSRALQFLNFIARYVMSQKYRKCGNIHSAADEFQSSMRLQEESAQVEQLRKEMMALWIAKDINRRVGLVTALHLVGDAMLCGQTMPEAFQEEFGKRLIEVCNWANEEVERGGER